MDTQTLLEYTQRGLLLAFWVCLPVALAAAVTGLVLAVLQATTQLQDQTTATIIKLIAAAVVLALTARWVGANVLNFADELLRVNGFLSATPKI